MFVKIRPVRVSTIVGCFRKMPVQISVFIVVCTMAEKGLPSFRDSEFPRFRVSEIPSFRDSEFPSFRDSEFPSFRVSEIGRFSAGFGVLEIVTF